MRYWEVLESANRLVEYHPEPTTSFIPLHGNYCGPGNRGGKPIDALDKACFKHDCEYDRSYKEDPEAQRKRQVEADKHFIQRALKVASDTTVSKVVRMKAYIAAQYFMKRLAKNS